MSFRRGSQLARSLRLADAQESHINDVIRRCIFTKPKVLDTLPILPVAKSGFTCTGWPGIWMVLTAIIAERDTSRFRCEEVLYHSKSASFRAAGGSINKIARKQI